MKPRTPSATASATGSFSEAVGTIATTSAAETAVLPTATDVRRILALPLVPALLLAWAFTVAAMAAIDPVLPPLGLSETRGLVWRSHAPSLHFDVTVFLGAVSFAALALGAGLGRVLRAIDVEATSPGQDAVAGAALGALAGTAVAGSVVAYLGLSMPGDLWRWWPARSPNHIPIGVAAGFVTAGCVVALTHGCNARWRGSWWTVRRLAIACATILGVVCGLGALRLVVGQYSSLGWVPARALLADEWTVVAYALRGALAVSIYLLLLVAFLAARTRAGARVVVRSRSAPPSRFVAHWSRFDAFQLHASIALVVAGAFVGGAAIWNGSDWAVPPQTLLIVRTLNAYLPSLVPPSLTPFLLLGALLVCAWSCVGVVLSPTMRRLLGRGKTVSWRTIATLAILAVTPAAVMLCSRMSDDYRSSMPVEWHRPVWWALVSLVILPSILAYTIALRRAVAPHDPRRLTRFLAIGLLANVVVVVAVPLFSRDDGLWTNRELRGVMCVVVPGFLAALALTTWSHSWMAGPLTGWHRRLCVHCGYPRHVPAGDACPECGRPWTKRRQRRIKEQGSRIKGGG
ncbi:MAG: hypothetical protein JNM94_08730 [Phycisphaerae bacterium]|nr:hypothetical protein [Phycisphaerae bacterium]